MKHKAQNRVPPGLRLLALLALTLAIITPAAQAAHPQHQTISTDATWDTDRTLDTDVVVANGATLTIKGVTVTAGASDTGGSYGKGLSDKIEIIVEEGGTLMVEPEAQLTASQAGDWYGVVFLAGSAGEVQAATISNGTVGITVYDASPTISGNTIQAMYGQIATDPGEDGGMAAGIVISGTSTSQVMTNTIKEIHGTDGQAGLGGIAGADGQAGGDGGPAYGILVMGGATPTLRSNTIAKLWGGVGGMGGNGSDGPDGVWLGGEGRPGGAGGRGGPASGIEGQFAGTGLVVEQNRISQLTGGSGGQGGDGGQGGRGMDGYETLSDGFPGASGGQGGPGGDAGPARGISVVGDSATVQGNRITQTIIGSWGGFGGWGGDGGRGGDGIHTTTAGTGGAGGPGGQGASGGAGGSAMAISVQCTTQATVARNLLSGTLSAGGGGNGGRGGLGGDGGRGTDGLAVPITAGSRSVQSVLSAGGNGGNGGEGGLGGDAGESGYSLGLILSAPSFTLARNRVTGADASGSGGMGGQGGGGGRGGDGGDATGNIGSPGGDGGAGGLGGPGGKGAKGATVMGLVFGNPGALAQAAGASGLDWLALETPGAGVNGIGRVENNLVYAVAGGDGANGGAGGTGGDGGDGGTPWGAGGFGGDGGDGGTGGDTSRSIGSSAVDGPAVQMVNNTLARVSPGFTVGDGGGAGSGGKGGYDDPVGNGSDGSTGTPGTSGSQDDAIGLNVDNPQATIVNNIIANPGVGMQLAAANAATFFGIYSEQPSSATLDYNDLWGWDQNYHNVTAGGHDTEQFPHFVDVNTDDYHLREDSPCRDAGTSSFPGLTLPSDDIDGDSRPQGQSHDMGSDEVRVPATPKWWGYLPLAVHHHPR